MNQAQTSSKNFNLKPVNLRLVPTTPHNLPARLPALIGRSAELKWLENELINNRLSLISLTGPGGIGKTSLTLALGYQALKHFAHGVFFVNLAPLDSPELIPQAVAQTLNLPENNSQTLNQNLLNFLRPKTMLLILDNFEHLISGASWVAEWLNYAPHLQILCASREPLRLYGEQEYLLKPLSVPSTQQALNLSTLAQIPAIALFVRQAQMIHPNFCLTLDNGPVIANICARLDGLPLAIELAAARLRVFSPQTLLAQLSAPSSLKLLSGGPQDSPPRQQTLHNTIAWSFELLSEAEQALFIQLSIFAGSFSLSAAQFVSQTDAIETLNHLTLLVEKNLIQKQPHSQPRFKMLQTIRAFGMEHLSLTNQKTAARQAHVTYYQQFVEQASQHLNGPQQETWLNKLELEHDNLRAALTWLLSQKDNTPYTLQALKMVGILGDFWHLRSHLSEGRRWLDKALSAAEYLPKTDLSPQLQAILATAYTAAGTLAWSQTDYTIAIQHHEASLQLYETLKNRSGVANCLNNLGAQYYGPGHYAQASIYYQQSLALYQEINDLWGQARVLNNIALTQVEMESNFILARKLYLQALAISRELNDAYIEAVTLHNLGEASFYEGDNQQAIQYHKTAFSLAKKLNAKQLLTSSLNRLGRSAVYDEDYILGASYYRQNLQLSHELGTQDDLADLLEGLALFAARRQAWLLAAEWLGGANAIRQTFNYPRYLLEVAIFNDLQSQIVTHLGQTQTQHALSQGETYPLETHLATIITWLEQLQSAPPASLSQTLNSLTPREQEVARLVTQGLTNSAIANQLSVVEKTVEKHISNILSKLGFTNRTEVAAYLTAHKK